MIFYDLRNSPHQLPEGMTVNWRISAYGLIQNQNQEVLVVVPTWRDSYDLPGGGVDKGEKIHEAIIREVYEETGYRATLDSNLPFHIEETNFYNNDENQYYYSINMFYKCKLISNVQNSSVINTIVEDEISKVEWRKINELTEKNCFFTHYKAIQRFKQDFN